MYAVYEGTRRLCTSDGVHSSGVGVAVEVICVPTKGAVCTAPSLRTNLLHLTTWHGCY